jgi:DNA-binding NarL/FixJ family response regulator
MSAQVNFDHAILSQTRDAMVSREKHVPSSNAKTKPSPRRILIADEHEHVRRSFRSLLESRQDLRACGEAKDGQEAIQLAAHQNPDLIMLDWTMPVLDGISASRQIKRILPDVPVLMLSLHHNREIVLASQSAGAQGFVPKTGATGLLLEAVNALLQGETFFAENNQQLESLYLST